MEKRSANSRPHGIDIGQARDYFHTMSLGTLYLRIMVVAGTLLIGWALIEDAIEEERLYTIDELLAPAIEKAKWGQDI